MFLRILPVVFIMGLAIPAAANRRCSAAHVGKVPSLIDLTRLVRPGQFRTSEQNTVLVDPEHYRGRRGVSAVESEARKILFRSFRQFTNSEMAEFFSAYLLRTHSVVAEVVRTSAGNQFQRIFVSGRPLQEHLVIWRTIVEREVEASGSMDRAYLTLLREIDKLVKEPPPSAPPRSPSTADAILENLLRVADRGEAVDPFSAGSQRLKEQTEATLIKSFDRILRHYKAARNLLATLAQNGQVQVRVVRANSMRPNVDVGEIFIGSWSLNIYLQDLSADIARNGRKAYLPESRVVPLPRSEVGPQNHMVSRIYQKK